MNSKLFVDKIQSLAETGVKDDHQPWERYLIRKVNYIALIGILIISSSIITYLIQKNYHFIIELLIILFLFPFIIVANKWLNYKWSLYMFYIISLGIMLVFSLKMGNESQIYLFFFPLIISLVLLLNRKESFKSLIGLLVLLFAFIILSIMNAKFHWQESIRTDKELENIILTNIFFSSIATLLFTIVLSRQNLKQENELNYLIKEKEILLAELHHRVKNNMTIILSLLNLKKEQCRTEEAKSALEDCWNRVYSMALVHQKVYNNKSMKEVNFGDYIKELSTDLVLSYSDKEKVSVNIVAENCLLGLDTAVPCGLIINELLTNSIKHAMVADQLLVLKILMRRMDKSIYISVSDNGPGMKENKNKSESLGLTLIDALSGQIEGSYEFRNNNGLEFSLNFK